MTATDQPTLVIIGGLLGAGKTTLAIEAARRLTDAGRRVGIVTNDQGSGLVDTALARVAHVPVREVAGGCFCCRLSDLLRAADSFARLAPEVIFAEPVGSCLDLAATVLRPILRDEAARFRVAPLTVLVDPARAHQLADAPDSDLAYLFRHQLEEADIVCYSKTDNGVAPPAVEGVAGHFVSARTGEGVGEWLDLVLGHERPSGQSPDFGGLPAVFRRGGGAGLAELAGANRARRRRSPPRSSSGRSPSASSTRSRSPAWRSCT